jgi:hypothetical protein
MSECPEYRILIRVCSVLYINNSRSKIGNSKRKDFFPYYAMREIWVTISSLRMLLKRDRSNIAADGRSCSFWWVIAYSLLITENFVACDLLEFPRFYRYLSF